MKTNLNAEIAEAQRPEQKRRIKLPDTNHLETSWAGTSIFWRGDKIVQWALFVDGAEFVYPSGHNSRSSSMDGAEFQANRLLELDLLPAGEIEIKEVA